MEAPARPNYLDPETLARGESLGLMALKIVEGYRVGEHRSPFKGFALEFAQHREYSVGDDLRHLDWKVLGKTDRYYVKQYEQDTNFTATLVLDGSASMNYGSGSITKFHYAKALTACLTYLVTSQGDAAAVHLVDEKVSESVQRTDKVGKVGHIMDRLAAFQTKASTHLGNSLEDVARKVKARGITVIISDLFDDEDRIEKGLQRLRFGGGEIIIFHVLDPYELEFPFDGIVEFIGLEGGPNLKVSPADLRQAYLQSLTGYRERIHSICDRAGCHYVLADTGKPLSETLSAYLAFRHKVNC
jgi:uncharacterized protein (DUF58 family)